LSSAPGTGPSIHDKGNPHEQAPQDVLVLATAGCLTVSLAGTAHAQRVGHRDARGDVVKATYDENTQAETIEPAPRQTAGDITGIVVRHAPRRVFVTVRFRELRAMHPMQIHVIQLKTNESLRRELSIIATPQRPQGHADFTRPNGDTVRCRYLRRQVDYAENVLRVSIPRRCLSHPRWVRVGMGHLRIPKTADGSMVIYADEAYRSGTVGDRLTLGPRVRRG
jgi:hypothetical protein